MILIVYILTLFFIYLEGVKWRILTMVTRNHGKNSPFKVQQFSLQTIYNHVVFSYKSYKIVLKFLGAL